MSKRYLLLTVFSFLLMFLVPCLYDSIRVRELCEVEGYTIIDCTWTSSRYRDDRENRSEDIVELDNGMVFMCSGFNGSLSSSRAVVFAIRMEGTEQIFYKILIEDTDRFYSATRIR